jgi:hypothetical protein
MSLEYIIESLRQKANAQHIYQLMELFQHLRASEARDCIFAFAGLHTTDSAPPKPDYTHDQDDASIFMNFTAWAFEDLKGLYLLEFDLQAGEVRDLPSWVPDFTASPPIEPNYWRLRLQSYAVHQACNRMTWSMQLAPPDCVSLKCIILGEVASVGGDVFELRDNDSHVRTLLRWHAFNEQLSVDRAVIAGEPYFDTTFATTMLGGVIVDQQGPARVATEQDLTEWRVLMSQVFSGQSSESSLKESPVMRSHIAAVLNRQLFFTTSGKLCIGPPLTRPGDELVMLAGGTSNSATCTVETFADNCTKHACLTWFGVEATAHARLSSGSSLGLAIRST